MKWIRPEVVEIDLGHQDRITGTGSKSGIVILSISGSGIVSRPLGNNDHFMSRVKSNSSLVWTKYDDHVCYMLASDLEQIKMPLNNCFIAGIAIGATMEEAGGVAQHLKEEISDVNKAFSSTALRAFLMRQAYRTIRLPVLLFWLIVLIGNFLISSHLGEAINTEYQLKRQAEIQQRNLQETTSHQKQLMADYKKLILPKSSVVFDRIASVVPESLQLTLMERLGKQTIILSGNALEMSEVLMFSESLKGKFNTVEIRSLETRVNDVGYSFNMLIEP